MLLNVISGLSGNKITSKCLFCLLHYYCLFVQLKVQVDLKLCVAFPHNDDITCFKRLIADMLFTDE